MKKWILFLLSAAALTVSAQEAIKLTAGKHNDFGLAYSLPITVVNVEVDATHVTAKAGPYYKYAEKYLGIQEIITEDIEYWEMNGINLSTTGIADKDNSYLIKFKSNTPASIYLSPEGTLWSVNMAPTKNFPTEEQTKSSTSKKQNNTYYSVLSEEQLAAGSVGKMAEVAAKQIYRIRESRLNLLTGDVDQLPADGESYKLIMSQLDAQEAALTEMFLGSVKKENVKKTLQFIPSGATGKFILFRFSKYMGVVDPEDLGGAPVYLSFETNSPIRESEEDRKKDNKNKGVTYIVPGKGTVTISSGSKVLKKQEVQVAQLGEIFQFPANMFDDKKEPAKAQFNPVTGAIEEILQ